MKFPKLSHGAVVAALAVFALGTGSAYATHVDPIRVAGNPNCPGQGFGIGFKPQPEPPPAGTYTIPGTSHTLTITYASTSAGQTFDWTSTLGMDAVIVKGGPNANLYIYNPPAASLGDTGLHAPVNPNGQYAGVSHIEFCLGEELQPNIVADKQMTGEWEREWTWELEKTVSPNVLDLFVGDSHQVKYTITTSADAAVTYRLSGTIVVTDSTTPSQVQSFAAFADVLTLYDAADNIVATLNTTGGSALDQKFAAAHSGCDQLSISGTQIFSCSFALELTEADIANLADVRRAANEAVVEFNFPSGVLSASDTAEYTFNASPDIELDEQLNVVDPDLPALDHVANAPAGSEVSANATYTCDEGDRRQTNTATGTANDSGDEVSDSAHVDIYCRQVSIEKTADAKFDRTYRWEADKFVLISAAKFAELDAEYANTCELIASGPNAGEYKCEKSLVTLGNSQPLGVEYLVEVEPLIDFDDNYRITGEIRISWPQAQHGGAGPDLVLPPSDTITFLGGATVNPSVNCDAPVLDAGIFTRTCSYEYQSDTVPALSGQNAATVTRNVKCYDDQGVASNCGTQAIGPATAGFTFALDGTTNACVEVVDYFNDDLVGDVIDANVCAAESFVVSLYSVSANDVDDYAVRDEENCLWTVPNIVILFSKDSDDEWPSSQADLDVSVPSLCQTGCTLTPGYWKTHSAYGPAPYDATWALIGEDTPFFLSGQTWYQALWTTPRGGNAYYILAHAYIAATLNTLNLSNPAVLSGDQLTAYNFATSVFSTYTPAQIGALKGNNALRSQIIAAAGVLDAWNNGITGPGHCDE